MPLTRSHAASVLFLAAMLATAAPTPAFATAPGKTAQGTRSGDGWRSAPPPAWVVRHDLGAGIPAAGPLAAREGWHALLVDEQDAIGRDDQSGHYLMMRTLITDTSGVGSAGRIEVGFDPAYQKVLLHGFAVYRDGHRLDRLADARIELLRREERLEDETIDGRKTLMLVLNDVRVNDVLEVSYSVLGHNPIHGPSHDGSLQLAFGMPVDRLLASVTSSSTRRLHLQGVRAGELGAVKDDGGVQRWQSELTNVPPVQPESETPVNYDMFPRVDYSDDADWHEVAEWGAKLFAVDSTLPPDLERRLEAWRAAGLAGAPLASAATSLVQDEVRYFSASLGENSHRPKAPARTWTDRTGDCKDKTALLVAILQRLGFDARPALVSTTARASLRDAQPSHDVFDHAIVRLSLDGRTWWLDGTRTSQGTRLETRAVTQVDWALVVAPETRALEAVHAPEIGGDVVTYDHVWDTSNLARPARLSLAVTTRSDVAEAYRATIAAGHLHELADTITAHYRTLFRDYRAVGEPVVEDDREQNRLIVRLEGEVPLLGQWDDGRLAIEVWPVRILDSLATPDQPKRTMPWAYEPPATLSERVRIVLPAPRSPDAPLRREASDPHFGLTLTTSGSAREEIFNWHFERRSDVVLPADLAHFRDRIAKARGDHDFVLKAALFDADAYRARIEEDSKGFAADPRMRLNDDTSVQIARAYARRVRDDLILSASGPGSRIGSHVLLDRAMQDVLLGEDDTAQADLARVATDAFDAPEAQYTRGLVLFTAGRFAEAGQAWLAGVEVANPRAGPARRWIGIAAYYDGRLADAVRSLREAAQDETGDERSITLAWLFIAAQRQDGKGEAAIAPFVSSDQADNGAWPTQLLTALRALGDMIARKDKPAGDFNDWAPARDLRVGMNKDPMTKRERGAQAIFFVSQIMPASVGDVAMTQLLQLEAGSHATALPEDICARTTLRRTMAHPS